MEATLHALGGILLKALPTLFIVLFLHFYLKRVFFRPLEAVLRQRHDATEGARQAAQTSLGRAEEKAAAYEAALRDARSEIYREQEQLRRKLLEEQTASLEEARTHTNLLIRDAQERLNVEAEKVKQELGPASERLADQILESILRGRAA